VAPFHTPWPTFLAWIVVAASILLSILHAILFDRPEEE